jgi:hypothetical protein
MANGIQFTQLVFQGIGPGPTRIFGLKPTKISALLTAVSLELLKGVSYFHHG